MRRAKRILVMAAVCVVVGVAAVLVLGDSEPRSQASEPPDDASTSAHIEDDNAAPRDVDASQNLGASSPPVVTSDPDAYAAAIATTVFGLDTRRSSPTELRSVLLGEADPMLSDEGRADLTATVDTRIPTADLWQRMRDNQQWSTWTPSQTWEPATWAQAVTSGYAEPGWVMRNVAGIQVTTYVEQGVEKSTSRERALSVLMRCPAPESGVDRCRLALVSTTVIS
jgi:hypothetical protein